MFYSRSFKTSALHKRIFQTISESKFGKKFSNTNIQFTNVYANFYFILKFNVKLFNYSISFVLNFCFYFHTKFQFLLKIHA